MPGITPGAQRTAHDGSRFLSQVIGDRAREARSLKRLSQEDVADRMELLGQRWVRQTVARVETADRNLTVDELVSLAAALQTSVEYLLSPASPADPKTSEPIDIGGPEPLGIDQLSALLGFRPDPYPRAWGYYEWPDMEFKVARGWDDVLWEAQAEALMDKAEGRDDEQ